MWLEFHYTHWKVSFLSFSFYAAYSGRWRARFFILTSHHILLLESWTFMDMPIVSIKFSRRSVDYLVKKSVREYHTKYIHKKFVIQLKKFPDREKRFTFRSLQQIVTEFCIWRLTLMLFFFLGVMIHDFENPASGKIPGFTPAFWSGRQKHNVLTILVPSDFHLKSLQTIQNFNQ